MKYYASSNRSLFNHLAFALIALLFSFSFSVHDRKNVEESRQIKSSNIISCAPNSFFNEPFDPLLEEVQINDNRKPAGELRNGIFYINLEIREGNWYPETKDGAPIKITAITEVGKPLQVPGPLIRVPEGTEIKATITNRATGQPHSLFGFYQRPNSNLKDSILIAPGETKQINFSAGTAGTYFYYANKGPFPHIRVQLYGALIVDAKNEKPDPAERIIMIGVNLDKVDTNLMRQYVMNGLTWPYTERLRYRQWELVKWRVINASRAPHPMRLHRFPFTLHSLGNIGVDSIIGKEKAQLMVTQNLLANTTMRISWIPSREGNWLFHCHLVDHIFPVSYLRNRDEMQHSNANLETHARDAMGGLIMGINVIPDKRFQARISKNKTATRKLTLVIGEKENYFDNSNGKGFQLVEKGKARLRDRQATANGFSIPGPPLVLIRDQTVAIKIINTLKEPTTMHWHGLEIDSYYDGVPGWGYMGMKLAPLIQPGDSFTVYLTPSRAGTFMYHTHMHDLQLLQGMYADLFGKHKSLLNGTSTPEILYLKKRKRYRFRIINIGAQNFGNFISIKQNGQLVSWTLIGKDGISLRKNQRQLKPSSQRVAIGETFDFEFSPDKPGDYLIEVAFASKPEVTQLVKVEE